MIPLSPPARRTALDPRRTAMAPLPHALDDVLGGLAAGLAVSGYVGWLMSRD